MATTIELYNKIYYENIQELYLSYNKITNVCPEIGRLQNLQTLDLSFNQITNICPEIGQLQNLQILYLGCNNILVASLKIWQLLNLRVLNLNTSTLTSICSEIKQLQNLQTLYLSYNQIINICPEIEQLQNLQVLYLHNNQITNICSEIGKLQNLLELYFNSNQITNVCQEIGQLQNLRILNLNYNQITNVFIEIGLLRNLRELYLSNNQITIIPANIIQCNNLTWIQYQDNNIEYYIPCVQRFLDRIRHTGGTIINIYKDGQNVHASSIQTSVRNSIFNLLNTNYERNETNNYIEDLVLTIKTKQLITEYISIKETHSQLDCTFEEVFRAVWNEILTLNVDFQNEVKKRLNEEMDDAECKCFTGRISRLVNCLSGYSDKVLIQISDSEQIGNIISSVRSKYKDSSIDEIKQKVKNELTERKFDLSIIEEWISYIN